MAALFDTNPQIHKQSVVALLLIVVFAIAIAGAAFADDSAGANGGAGDYAQVSESPALAAAGLLADLEDFLQQRDVDVGQLTVDRMVGIMVDWYRATPFPAAAGGGTDMLLFRYGGWSEGCATGFNVSLLRRAGEHGTAGITLMFEPSSGAEIKAFATALPNRQLIDTFTASVHASPAFQQFGTARPMQVLLEKGGLR